MKEILHQIGLNRIEFQGKKVETLFCQSFFCLKTRDFQDSFGSEIEFCNFIVISLFLQLLLLPHYFLKSIIQSETFKQPKALPKLGSHDFFHSRKKQGIKTQLFTLGKLNQSN